jgi:hypothetical protein
MDRVRRLLGYELTQTAEHVKVDQRLNGQQLRIQALDAAISAQNAAPPRRYRGPERRRARR